MKSEYEIRAVLDEELQGAEYANITGMSEDPIRTGWIEALRYVLEEYETSPMVEYGMPTGRA